LYEQLFPLSNLYKIHTFTSGGTFTVTGSGTIEYLVVGGGGGGGGCNNNTVPSGGGGAGGFRTAKGLVVTAQGYTVTVGLGGTGGVAQNNGTNGGNSTFSTITSLGGGGGGSGITSGANGLSGGSGGGAGYTATGGTSGTYGNNGGNGGSAGNYSGGGGGGSGSVGVNGSGNNGGAGGSGSNSSITGSAVSYTGGGGGGGYSSGGSGSYGGGAGKSFSDTADGNSGVSSSGSGGGGTSYSGSHNGGTGGSGIVIIKYSTSSGITATGGTITTINENMKQRVVENFSGDALDERWTVTIQTSTFTAPMSDSVDGGCVLTTGTGTNHGGSIQFNDIRQYAHDGSVFICVSKVSDISNIHQTPRGFSSGIRGDSAGNDISVWSASTVSSQSNFFLRTANGAGAQSESASTVSKDTSWHSFKIENKASSVEGQIDGLTIITHSTNLPTVKMQPLVGIQNGSSGSSVTHSVRYVECYNT
jgi:hypothetical protein